MYDFTFTEVFEEQKSGEKQLEIFIYQGQNCPFMSSSSPGGLYSTSRGQVHPRSATGHLASWHLTGNLLGSQSEIPQSHNHHRVKTLIQSLGLYSNQTDFQPCHRSAAPPEAALGVLKQQ